MRTAEFLSGNRWLVTDDATGRSEVMHMSVGADAAAAVAAFEEAVDGPSAEKIAAEERLGAVLRAEAACRAHIYAALSETAQKTLMAARHRMTTEEATLHDAGLDWIADCRDEFRAFAAGEAEDYTFPAAPDGLTALGNQTRFGE